MRTRTGGAWDPEDRPRYFLAHGYQTLSEAVRRPLTRDHLIAVNIISNDKDYSYVERALARGFSMVIDSGVFNLANAYAMGRQIPIEQVLTMPPEDLAGFGELLAHYKQFIHTYGARSWGYIEIDQGGTEAKRRTRAGLEAEGIFPIPVFHPLSDGWDYFDELCEGYDRVAFANLVQAGTGERKRLMATLWEKRQRHRGVWIHALGLTPSTLTVAYPVDSADSSSWVSAARWGKFMAWAAGKRLWDAGAGWLYEQGQDAESFVWARGVRSGWALGDYDAAMVGRVLHGMCDDTVRVLGADPFARTCEGAAEAAPALEAPSPTRRRRSRSSP